MEQNENAPKWADFPDAGAIVTEFKIESAQRVRLEPGDVLVVFSERPLPTSAGARISERLNAVFPDNQVVVLDKGLRLAVLGADE